MSILRCREIVIGKQTIALNDGKPYSPTQQASLSYPASPPLKHALCSRDCPRALRPREDFAVLRKGAVLTVDRGDLEAYHTVHA
jgi:hypothetical protein